MMLKTKIGFLMGLTLSCVISAEPDGQQDFEIIRPLDLDKVRGSSSEQRTELHRFMSDLPLSLRGTIPLISEPLNTHIAALAKCNRDIVSRMYTQLEQLVGKVGQLTVEVETARTNLDQFQGTSATEKTQLEEQLILKQTELSRLQESFATQRTQLEESVAREEQLRTDVLNQTRQFSLKQTELEQLQRTSSEDKARLEADLILKQTELSQFQGIYTTEKAQLEERYRLVQEELTQIQETSAIDKAQLEEQLGSMRSELTQLQENFASDKIQLEEQLRLMATDLEQLRETSTAEKKDLEESLARQSQNILDLTGRNRELSDSLAEKITQNGDLSTLLQSVPDLRAQIEQLTVELAEARNLNKVYISQAAQSFLALLCLWMADHNHLVKQNHDLLLLGSAIPETPLKTETPRVEEEKPSVFKNIFHMMSPYKYYLLGGIGASVVILTTVSFFKFGPRALKLSWSTKK